MREINTHGLTINFGKHGPKDGKPGMFFTRLPVGYLRWMINENTKMADIAKAEFKRRGCTMPTVELSGHAIDKASLRVQKIWYQTMKPEEGLYSWLQRITLEAIDEGEKLDGGKIKYMGMKLVVAQGEEFPTLKTIML